MHCGTTYKYDKSTGTMIEHLSRVHKLVDVTPFLRNRRVESPSLQQLFVSMSPERKAQIDDALFVFIGKDAYPPYVVEGAGFKAFVKALNTHYSLPSRQTVRKRLKEKRQEIEAKAISLLL